MSARKNTASHNQDAPMLLGGTAIKPPERHGWERVRYILHNPETGEILSRTPKSWLLIFLFYCVYYTCLAGFWYGMLQIFFLTLKEDMPKWVMEESIIGVNPGMGIRPRQADARIDSAMLFFNTQWDGVTETSNLEEDSDAGFAARMKHFLERSIRDGQPDAVVCNNDELNDYRPDGQAPCKFEASTFGVCSKFPYGYAKDSQGRLNPCVIVKLNKIFGLKPTPYSPDDELPEDFPAHLKPLVQDVNEPRRVYIHCQGENPADVEQLTNKMEFFPSNQGIPLGFFPHQKKDNLASPAIAIQFHNLTHGQLLHVECKAWFKGVKHDNKDRLGMSVFEVFID